MKWCLLNGPPDATPKASRCILVSGGEGVKVRRTWRSQQKQKSWCYLTVVTLFFFPLHSLLNFFSFPRSEYHDLDIRIINRYICSSLFKSMQIMLKEGRMGAKLKCLGISCLHYLDLEDRVWDISIIFIHRLKIWKMPHSAFPVTAMSLNSGPWPAGTTTHSGNGDYWLNFLLGSRAPAPGSCSSGLSPPHIFSEGIPALP